MSIAVFLLFFSYSTVSIGKSSANDYVPFYGGGHTISIALFEFYYKTNCSPYTFLKIKRMIFGPVLHNGFWKIGINGEISAIWRCSLFKLDIPDSIQIGGSYN